MFPPLNPTSLRSNSSLGPAYVAKPTSCGQPLPIVEAKVVDPDTGKLLGPNQPGELLMKSALGMKGYWNKPEGTPPQFPRFSVFFRHKLLLGPFFRVGTTGELLWASILISFVSHSTSLRQ